MFGKSGCGSCLLWLILIITLRMPDAFGQYCSSNLYTVGCSYGDFIGDFSLAGFSQTNTGCANDSGYSDFSAEVILLEQGNSYTLKTVCGFDEQYLSIWMDWDDDFEFEPQEKLLSDFYCETGGIEYATNLVVPFEAATGQHRMRVRGVYNKTNTEPCTQYAYGEVHDYTAEVSEASVPMQFQNATTMQPNLYYVTTGDYDAEILRLLVETTGNMDPLALTSLVMNSEGSTDFGGDVSGVHVYYTGLDSVFSTSVLFASAPDFSLPLTGNINLLPGKNYFWIAYDVAGTATIGNQLDAECLQLTLSGSGGVQFPGITSPPGSREINYCIPAVDNGCEDGDYIHSVWLHTLSNENSGCNGLPNAYINYPATSGITTTLEFDSSYQIIIERGTEYPQGLGAWMDLNNDSDFEDDGEFLFATADADTGLVSGWIALPNDSSVAGLRRLRIRSIFYLGFGADDFCSTIGYGETEDYTVTIAYPACDGIPVPGIIASASTQFCQDGTPVNLTLNDLSFETGLSYQWEESADGLDWTAIAGAAQTVYTAQPVATTHYRVQTMCLNSGLIAFSDPVEITEVAAPAAPQVSDSSRCGPGTVELTASGSGIGYLDWYDAPTGGNQVGSGETFITPSLSSSTSYFVEEVVGLEPYTCSGPRTKVNAVLYLPKILTGILGTANCPGDTFNVAAQNNGQGTFEYQWSPILPGMIPPDGSGLSVFVPLYNSTVFTLVATEISGQCDTSIQVPVPVDPIPAVSLSGLNDEYFFQDTVIILSGSPAGGSFSGNGVSGNTFNPFLAGSGGPYLITYVYTDGVTGCSGADSFYVTVSPPLWITPGISGNAVSAYPNPGDGLFTVALTPEWQDPEIEIQLFDLLGRAIINTFQSQPASTIISLDFLDLPAGSYFLELRTVKIRVRLPLIIH